MHAPNSEADGMTQPKITEYRQLTKAEVNLMNEGKDLAGACNDYIVKLRSLSGGRDFYLHFDERWIAIGATDLQTGFMALMRAIAKPTTF